MEHDESETAVRARTFRWAGCFQHRNSPTVLPGSSPGCYNLPPPAASIFSWIQVAGWLTTVISFSSSPLACPVADACAVVAGMPASTGIGIDRCAKSFKAVSTETLTCAFFGECFDRVSRQTMRNGIWRAFKPRGACPYRYRRADLSYLYHSPFLPFAQTDAAADAVRFLGTRNMSHFLGKFQLAHIASIFRAVYLLLLSVLLLDIL